MNRLSSAVVGLVALAGVVHADTVTNYTFTGNGSQDVALTNNQYVGITSGGIGRDSAAITNINALTVAQSGFSGAAGGAGINAPGGNGLTLSNVKSVIVTNMGTAVLKGGNGGTSTPTTGGSTVSASGGYGLRFAALNNTQTMQVDKLTATGGNGGKVSGTINGVTATALGGDGLNVNNAKVAFGDLTLQGGNGGAISLTQGNSLDASGGYGGYVLGASSFTAPMTAGTKAVGGQGGSAANTSGSATAGGGTGFRIATLSATTDFQLNGGTYIGGKGGSASAAGATATASASGGIGFQYAGKNDGSTTATVSGGTFTGGDGGVAANATGTAQANGGRGAYFVFSALVVNGGTFKGGAAGLANGVAGEAGAGLWGQDLNATINGGTFLGNKNGGKGFVLQALNRASSAATINGGTFEDVEFQAAAAKANNVVVKGGTFQNVLLSGDGTHSLSVSNATLNDVQLKGASTRTISFLAGANSSGKFTQTGGATTVAAWNDANFKQVSLTDGSIGFNGALFNLDSGETFTIRGSSSKATFNGGIVLDGGSTLDVGLGRVHAPTLTADAGSAIKTAFGDSGTSLIYGRLVGNNLMIDPDTDWTIYGATAKPVLSSLILLASATNSLTANLDGDDFTLLNNPAWLYGITGTTNKLESGLRNLYATYGIVSLDQALGAEGDFGQAMADLNSLLTPATFSALTNAIKTEAQAQQDLHEEYVRTPEVASTLIGLQSLMTDQIKDRTRSYLALEGFGVAGAPEGAKGPSEWYGNTMDWLGDRLPSWDVGGSMREIEDRNKIDYDRSVDAVNEATTFGSKEQIKVPDTYQAWGRGYVSGIQQDAVADFVGYDAVVAGAVLGADKRFGNALAGLGGGYAHTEIQGNVGSDAKIDTGNVMAYFAAHGERAYFDASANYAYNAVETEGVQSLKYTGEYDAHTFGLYFGGGYAIGLVGDKVVLTPEASLLSTFYARDAYTETSTLMTTAPKYYDSYDQWSYLGSLGATLSMVQYLDSFRTAMAFRPELRAHWLHEFNADMDPETYHMVPGSDINVFLQAREEDLVKVGAGMRFSKWQSETTELGFDLDGIFGGDYAAYVVSGKIMHRF